MRTLICDLNVYDEGHHIAYVNSILEYSADQENTIFLYNRAAENWCPGLRDDKRVFWVEEDLLHKSHQNLILGKFREYDHIRRFAIQHKVDRVVLLDIDQYQLAIGFMPAPYKVTGIYFRSFHHVRISSGSLSRSVKNALYYMKKRVMFQVLRLNRRAEPLYLLNDRKAAGRSPKWFAYLPDPVFTNRSPLGSGMRELYDIPQSVHVFLVFGAMGARKNIANIVASYLEASLSKPSVLLIAGKVRADYKDEFYMAVRHFKESNQAPDKRLIAVDEFIEEDLIDAYFRESDTILLCYQKFYGSSGLMGKAALHERACIVPHEGLLNDLCSQYSLGFATDPLDIKGMARAMARAQHEPLRSPGRSQFVTEHSESAFIRTLLH